MPAPSPRVAGGCVRLGSGRMAEAVATETGKALAALPLARSGAGILATIDANLAHGDDDAPPAVAQSPPSVEHTVWAWHNKPTIFRRTARRRPGSEYPRDPRSVPSRSAARPTDTDTPNLAAVGCSLSRIGGVVIGQAIQERPT